MESLSAGGAGVPLERRPNQRFLCAKLEGRHDTPGFPSHNEACLRA